MKSTHRARESSQDRAKGPAAFRAALGASLALAVLTLSGVPAVAQASVTAIAPVGSTISISASAFDDAGTNPKFTDVEFTTTEYYVGSNTGIVEGQLIVEVKTAAQLNALPSPPDSPFTVTATVTMTNDEDQTATGTVTLETTYVRAPTSAPTISDGDLYAPTGTLVSIAAAAFFDNAGTNPEITAAVFSTTEYYDTALVRDGEAWIQPKSAADLNALPSPPPSPFTVTVTVTMTNDEGQTATGTVSVRTNYARGSPPAEPIRPPPPVPTAKSNLAPMQAPPGARVRIGPRWAFDNAGTNPKITDVVLSTAEYYTSNWIEAGSLIVRVKTTADLNAMSPRPPSPFTVTATLTMKNGEGQQATAKVALETLYARTSGPAPSQPEEPAGPTFVQTAAIVAYPGFLTYVNAADVFDNAGTNARFTSVEFSTMEYYKSTSGLRSWRVWADVKSDEDLSALRPPPPNPFTVTAEVEMTNDEGQTASGTLTFKTTYTRVAAAPPPPPTPIAGASGTAHPGYDYSFEIASVFDNAGTNPKFTAAEFSTMEYYDDSVTAIHPDVTDWVNLRVKSDEQLNALSPPPPNPFTVTATVTMTNDEGATATGTFVIETTYRRATNPPPEGGPIAKSGVRMTVDPGVVVSITADEVFDNAGTNARFTSVEFSTIDYYDAADSNIQSGRLFVKAKTAAELSALAAPPDSPFTVTATVKMTNDEGETASGTVELVTSYRTSESDDRSSAGAPSAPGAGGGDLVGGGSDH